MESDRAIDIKGIKFIPKRCLKGYPVKVIEAMISEAEKQGNKKGITKILENLDENSACMLSQGGFTWVNASGGIGFWGSVINQCEPERRKFNLIFKTNQRDFVE